MKARNRIKTIGAVSVALLLSGSVYGGDGKTLADIGSTGGSGDSDVGLVDRGDGTYALVFTNTEATTFTFNSDWALKEFLVVGGGGAGGGNGGAGGGGGGVIWYTDALLAADNVQTNFTDGQSISLTIGAGGTGAFKATGVPGGSSSLTIGSAVYTAFGGAGGGNYNDPPSVDRNAAPGVGGTGCGAAGYGDGGTGADTTMDTSKPGYYANNSGSGVKVSNQTYSGGGGGAGEAGGDAVTTGTKMGGKGGDGLPCSITGAEVYYAAGGGGSTSNPNTTKLENEAEGGRGGGGHASAKGARDGMDDKGSSIGIAPSDPSVHASGYGCGGGGGGGGSGACCFGGNGSAGIVVLAIMPTGSEPEEEDPDDPDPDDPDPDDPVPTVITWGGAVTGDWKDPENWTGGVVPSTGTVVRVTGTATITRGRETARITDAEIKVGEDGSLTLVSGSVMPHPTLNLKRPVAGRPLTVETGTFGGITGGVFTVQWKKGASVTSKSYQNLSTETSITPTAADYGYFFKCEAKDAASKTLWTREFYFSKLPVLYMTTDDGKTPTAKKEEHTGYVFVQGNAEWKSPYDGAMTIKMRGNTTTGSTYRKKPWKLKLDSKAEMFGIAKSKHWVLMANDKEKSAMRNKLAYDLANEIGSLGMESTWVECFLNGTYQGLYLFAEQIRVAGDRVDIFDWEGAGEDAADAIAEANGFTDEYTAALEELMATNLAWVTSGKVTFKSVEYAVTEDFRNLDTTGGYLFESSKEMDEASRFTITSGTLTFEAMLNSPEFLKTNSEMFNDCKTRVQDYLAALASPDGYNAKGVSWVQLADIDAMATYLLTIEVLGNDDAEKKSRYFYWDVGGPIKFGPVWDFDWGVGNTLVDKNIGNPESWRAHNNNPRSFYREWTDDPWFCTRLRTLYWSRARDVLARMISDGGEIDRYHDYLAEAAAADEVKWPIKADSGAARTYETDVTNLVEFLTARLAWLDQQFADVPTLMESFKKSCSHEYSSRPDLDDLPSNCPYTADTEGLSISFPNTPTDCITIGTALEVSATVASNEVATVDVYVNGLKIGDSLSPESGSVAAEVPADALTETSGADNCVALVARDASGEVVSRNYALVRTVSGTDQSGLRFYEIYGSTTGDGDTGEYIVLTNVSAAAIDLTGVKLNLQKLADYKDRKNSKCVFTLTEGTVAAGGSIRLSQDEIGWEKITNGKLHIEIFDAAGKPVQVGETSFGLYPGTDGGGAAIRAKRFDNDVPLAATAEDWEPSVQTAAETVTPGTPLGPYDTEAEATEVFGRAVFAPSDAVAAALGSDAAITTYCDMFGLDVVPTSGGKWAVAAYLLPEPWTNLVLSAQEASRQLPVAELALRDYGTPLENVLITNCVPGFYYSLYDGSTVTNLKADVNAANGNILCGPDQKVIVPVLPKPSPAAGFFAIGVLEIPTVYIPGSDHIVTGYVPVIPGHPHRNY